MFLKSLWLSRWTISMLWTVRSATFFRSPDQGEMRKGTLFSHEYSNLIILINSEVKLFLHVQSKVVRSSMDLLHPFETSLGGEYRLLERRTIYSTNHSSSQFGYSDERGKRRVSRAFSLSAFVLLVRSLREFDAFNRISISHVYRFLFPLENTTMSYCLFDGRSVNSNDIYLLLTTNYRISFYIR